MLKSNCPTQPTTSLPIDILNDEMVRVVKYMNSDPLKYGFTLIFVTTTPIIRSSMRIPSMCVDVCARIDDYEQPTH